MKIHKIPLMSKEEYDKFIKENYVSRIGFKGEYPYIAPFLYVFDGDFIYFMSTKYGKKIKRFQANPNVAVEIEKYEDDLSEYRFVTLQGRIEQVENIEEKLKVKKCFLNLIQNKSLSKNVLAALGHSPDDELESIVNEDRSYIWKLVDVKSIIGIKTS
ncbi:pyridoxamine 5'-phosphate oxidase-related FMN-binding protein [Methanobacterium lacus]|uniref:Pyridoxamine 5'-phosphate oxidase-related FMN-binding protein n=2 Tax=Methanobacterium lacus (strain AL-21) TaxID=877455 RepID=F0T7P5_METLA|nr:pyridoxamine 5'-phosphate oxidase-related FMN-binding protein [Methanobacterium lacus]